MRTGTLARKLGMSRVFLDNGQAIPVTVLQMDGVQVVARRQPERDGYAAVQLGAGTAKVRRVPKAMRGHFANAGVAPKQVVREFRVPNVEPFEPGTEFGAQHFAVGQHVDVRGVSKGKGFAGVMKRHGFGGLRASHGVSINHRSQGSTGQCQDPGRVFKGKKMAGQLGDTNVTVQNLEVIVVDPKHSVLMVKGAVPGAKNSWVTVRDSIKKPATDLPEVPEPYVPDESEPEAPEESVAAASETDVAGAPESSPAVDAAVADEQPEVSADSSEVAPAEVAVEPTDQTSEAVAEAAADQEETAVAEVASEPMTEVAAPPTQPTESDSEGPAVTSEPVAADAPAPKHEETRPRGLGRFFKGLFGPKSE